MSAVCQLVITLATSSFLILTHISDVYPTSSIGAETSSSSSQFIAEKNEFSTAGHASPADSTVDAGTHTRTLEINLGFLHVGVSSVAGCVLRWRRR